jgi:MFS family permease
MTRVATGWLVYRLTGSAFLLGLVSFAGQIPILVLGPFAGVWVDRWNRHRVLVVTQALSMLESFGLAALALTHSITVHEVILLNLFQGAINSFDMPARQAFVIEMVEEPEDLGNAIALNSSLVNAARLIGPSVAGLIIAGVGEGYCFLIDGVSYLAVIASLLLMIVIPRSTERAHPSVLSELRDGWNYVVGFRPIWLILLLLVCISLVGMPLHDADADFCREGAAWWSTHTGFSDGSGGGWGACWCGDAGGAAERPRIGPSGSYHCGGVWRFANCVRGVASAWAVFIFAGHYRVLLHAKSGVL